MKTSSILSSLSMAFALILSIQVQAQKPTTDKLPAGITEQQVRAHKIDAVDLRDIKTENDRPEVAFKFKAGFLPQPKNGAKALNSSAFASQFHAAIKDEVTGYAMQLRKNGAPNQTLIWNWAKTPANGSKGWNLDTRMHVASVSKMITGIAMYKLLLTKGISLDAKIINYLPAYWAKGSNIGMISFRNLLNHTSGIEVPGSATNFATMKGEIAAGVNAGDVGDGQYENTNFGLCRILIPIINGDISKNANFGVNNDLVWDVCTISAYRNYVQAKVFTPAGVNNAGFAPPNTNAAFAYHFPHANLGGWNSGDLSTLAGGVGWRLSVKEVLDVMNHVRRKNTILTVAQAQYLLDNKLGLDRAINTPAGKMYDKNGSWASGGGSAEKCVATFLPDGYEIVVFVNSPIGLDDASIREIVKEIYLANLQ